jgi:chorismate mutase/prephenate dehydratase
MPDRKPAPAAEKPYNSPALDDIRRKIDELDDRIHDTLMERAELVLKVGQEKKKNNIQIVQPAREARMIRRLLGRHEGVLPEMAVVRIWRELVGAVSLLQTGLKVVVAQSETQSESWDLARDYFGSCLPMSRASSPIAAISALKDGKTTFAVVPWPEMESEQPWWTYLGPGQPEPMSIIVALPHGRDPDNSSTEHRALVVSKSGFDDSGEDNSFLLIQCDSSVSRGKLVDIAKGAGLTALALSSKRTGNPSLPAVHLMEVEDYIGKDDKRLKDFIKAFEDAGANVVCIGGYPVPPSYARTVKSPGAEQSSIKASA